MTVSFEVALPAPLDVAGSLEVFRRSGDDLIDRWDGEYLVRAIPTGAARWVPVAARPIGQGRTTSFAVVAAHDIDEVRHAITDSFAPAPPDYTRLLQEDPILAALDAQHPGIRQIRQLDVFTALVRCVSAQQVNLRWAVTTRRRLAESFGRHYQIDGRLVYALDPERIARTDAADIRALQFTMNKSIALVAIARAVVEDPNLDVKSLSLMDDDEVIRRLTAIRGIGLWSAEWVLARTLARPRVVAGDLGVRKAVGLAYLSTPLPSETEVRAATAHWGECAGVAQALLLHALGEGTLKPPSAPPRSPAASRR